MRDLFTGKLRRYDWSDLHIHLEEQETIARPLPPRIEATSFRGTR